MNKWELFTSATVSCASANLPWPTDKSRMIAALAASFGDGVVGLIANLEDQYNKLKSVWRVGLNGS